MKMYIPPAGAPNSRRAFLKKGLFGGALLALGGGGYLFSRPSASVTVPAGLKVLSAREFAVVSTLVQRFAPVGKGFPTPDAVKAAEAVDTIISLLEEETRAELKQVLMLFENALPNFLFGFRTTPFTKLPVEEQEVVLNEWRDSSITIRRTAYRALRGLSIAGYYGHKDVWPAIGYGGPPQGIHDPNAPVWKGGGEPRPIGNGTFIEQVAEAPTPPAQDAAPENAPAPDAGVTP